MFDMSESDEEYIPDDKQSIESEQVIVAKDVRQSTKLIY